MIYTIAGDVVGGARVGVPNCVDSVGVHGGVDVAFVGDVVGVEAVPALRRGVSLLEADLATSREALTTIVAPFSFVRRAIATPSSTIVATTAIAASIIATRATGLVPTSTTTIVVATKVATSSRRVD